MLVSWDSGEHSWDSAECWGFRIVAGQVRFTLILARVSRESLESLRNLLQLALLLVVAEFRESSRDLLESGSMCIHTATRWRAFLRSVDRNTWKALRGLPAYAFVARKLRMVCV